MPLGIQKAKVRKAPRKEWLSFGISSILQSMSEQSFVTAFIAVLGEAFSGGEAGKGTAFLDNTNADGTGNHGFFAALDSLSAAQASDATMLGSSIAAHTAHTAFHIEATLRYVTGDRSPNDWQASFEPRVVSELEWITQRNRLKAAHQNIVQLARETPVWDEDSASGLMATLAHVSYHLGAVKQIIKLARG